MEFYVKETIYNERVAITCTDIKQGDIIIEGTTMNYYRCPLFKLSNGRIERFTLSKEFIKESGILTDNDDKISVID